MRLSCGSKEIQPQVQPPPVFHWSPCQVLRLESLPTGLPSAVVFSGSTSRWSSGPCEWARHARRPLFKSYAVTWQSTPNSPPEMPIRTLSLITIGADVPVSPFAGSPFFACQTTFPSLASSATSVVSACCRKILPSAYASPRLTVSQHITGITVGSCLGSYFHLISWSERAIANTLLGNGLWMYSMSPITSGPPSCPRRTPVENVHATRRDLTLLLLICLSAL